MTSTPVMRVRRYWGHAALGATMLRTHGASLGLSIHAYASHYFLPLAKTLANIQPVTLASVALVLGGGIVLAKNADFSGFERVRLAAGHMMKGTGEPSRAKKAVSPKHAAVQRRPPQRLVSSQGVGEPAIVCGENAERSIWNIPKHIADLKEDPLRSHEYRGSVCNWLKGQREGQVAGGRLEPGVATPPAVPRVAERVPAGGARGAAAKPQHVKPPVARVVKPASKAPAVRAAPQVAKAAQRRVVPAPAAARPAESRVVPSALHKQVFENY